MYAQARAHPSCLWLRPPPAEGITAEKAQTQLRASRRGKLPIVDAEGRLVGLATRTLFRDNARMPFGGERAEGSPPVPSGGGLDSMNCRG